MGNGCEMENEEPCVFHTYAYKRTCWNNLYASCAAGATKRVKRKENFFFSRNAKEESHGRMGQMEGGKQTAKATKSENLNQCWSQMAKGMESAKEKKKYIRKRYQVFIYMTFVCHSTSGLVYLPQPLGSTPSLPWLIVCHQNVCRFRF